LRLYQTNLIRTESVKELLPKNAATAEVVVVVAVVVAVVVTITFIIAVNKKT
jgi:hypothetical protein